MSPVVSGWAYVHHSLPMSQARPPARPSKQGTPPAHCPLIEHSSLLFTGIQATEEQTQAGKGEITCPRSSPESAGQASPGAGLARCRPQGYALKPAFLRSSSTQDTAEQAARAGSRYAGAGPCCIPHPHTLGSGGPGRAGGVHSAMEGVAGGQEGHPLHNSCIALPAARRAVSRDTESPPRPFRQKSGPRMAVVHTQTTRGCM